LGERDVVALDGLAIDQHSQALVETEAIAIGQVLLLLERLGHAGKPQAAQCLDCGVDHNRSFQVRDGGDRHGRLSCSRPDRADCRAHPSRLRRGP
jgi:hypothetical protein